MLSIDNFLAALKALGLSLDYLDIIRARKVVRPPKAMPILNIEATKRCNLSCLGCGYASYFNDNERELSLDQYRLLLTEAKKMGCLLVSFSGGEPFIRKDFIEIVEECDGVGMAVHVDSNGMLIAEGTARRLGKIGRLFIGLSLDHFKPELNDKWRSKGAFEGVKRAAELLRNYAPLTRLAVNVTLHGGNSDALAGIAELAAEWGFSEIRLLLFHKNLQHSAKPEAEFPAEFELKPERNADLKQKIADFSSVCKSLNLDTNSSLYLDQIAQPKFLPCWVGFVSGNLDPYGNLFPCYDHRIPNPVFPAGLSAAWRSSAMQDMRKAAVECRKTCVAGSSLEPSICFNLPFLVEHPLYLLDLCRKFIVQSRSTGEL
ncbi:MAG: hypothetical protein Kow0090_03640 [Myxococcota bacterium]